MPTLRFPLCKVVQPDTQHAGRDLQQGHPAAVAGFPQVGCNRLCSLSRTPSAVIEADPKRWREAFFIFLARHFAGEWLAIDDHGQDQVCFMQSFEAGDLLIDPARFRGCPRAKDDQEAGSGDRFFDFLTELRSGRQLMAVAEDWGKFLGDGAEFGQLPDEAVGNLEFLKCLVKPFGRF